MLILVVFFVVEGSARTYEFFAQDCNLQNAKSLDDLNYFLKRQICYDQQNLIYFENPVLSLVPNQHLSTVNINNDGFRGPELETNPSYRIFIIGGSTVFGAGLPSDEFTISSKLDEFLNDDDNTIEVINAGISSITSFEELYHIEKNILNYNPDMIIIYDGVNDIFYKKINQSEILNEKSETKDYQRYLRSPVVLYRYFILPLMNAEIFDSPGNQHKVNNYDPLLTQNLASLWEERMNKFCELSVNNDIRSVVIVQPALYNGKKPLSYYEESIVKENIHGKKTFDEIIERSKNLENCSLVLDYTAIFENIPDSIYFDQVHTNSLGNNIIAEKTSDEILFLISP
jgi:lysophospholipase L1-like esterase